MNVRGDSDVMKGGQEGGWMHNDGMQDKTNKFGNILWGFKSECITEVEKNIQCTTLVSQDGEKVWE